VFERLLHGRQLFEQVLLKGLRSGAPTSSSSSLHAASRAAPRDASRRVVTRDTEPKLKISYKHSSIRRQYKTGDALR
jgi:hypothetical protein